MNLDRFYAEALRIIRRHDAKLAKCGAKTRAGTPCRCKPRENGRCKFHGGASTGPRTKAGRKRIADAQRKRWVQYRQTKGQIRGSFRCEIKAG